MEVMQISLLLLLAAIQLHVTLAADRISGKRDHSSGKDPVSARDIRLEVSYHVQYVCGHTACREHGI